jgi:hypothetical protein
MLSRAPRDTNSGDNERHRLRKDYATIIRWVFTAGRDSVPFGGNFASRCQTLGMQ